MCTMRAEAVWMRDLFKTSVDQYYMEGDSKFGFRFLQHKSRKARMYKFKKSRKAATKRDVGHYLRGTVFPIIAFYALPPSLSSVSWVPFSLSLSRTCVQLYYR